MEPQEWNSSEKVNNDKNIRVSIVKSMKFIITTTSIISASKKLSTVSTKVTLL